MRCLEPRAHSTAVELRRLGVVGVLAAVLSLAFLVCQASAASPPSYARDIPIPAGAQIGSGDLTVNCSLDVAGFPLSSTTANALATGALPTIVRPGQSLWVTDVHVRTTLPAQVTDQLYSLGIRKLQVTLLQATEGLRDGANSTADLAKDNNIQIPTITLVQGQPIVVSLGDSSPLKLGPLATQGPGIAHLALGETRTQATAETADGTPLFTVQTDCPTPNPPQLIATVDVAGKPGTGQVSVPGDYPVRSVPDNSLVGSTGFEYRCRIPGAGTSRVDGSGTQFGSFGPGGLVFASGRQLPFQDTQGSVVLRSSLVNRLIKLIARRRHGRSGHWVRYTLDHTHFTESHLLPARSTLSPRPVRGSTGRLRRGRPLRLSFPRAGTVLAPLVLTAGSPGIADEFLGDEAFSLQPVNRRGQPVGSALRATCPTPEPLVPIFPAVIQ